MKQPAAYRAWCIVTAIGLFLPVAYSQEAFRYFYDGNGQLFRVLDSSGNLVEYDYDASGNPTSILRSTVASGSLAILNVVPQRGGGGSTVTIYGQNFSAVASGDTVMFNGVAATVISASSTALVVSAPAGVTTGPVSVTVNGTTVTSGTLNFTVPNLPTITSLSPGQGYNGQTLTVNVQGANLTNASFEFLGSGGVGVSNVSIIGGTQASFTANIGQVGGIFVLTALNDFGASSGAATNANTFHVYGPPGGNFVSVRLAVFNTYLAGGSQPGTPAGSHAANQTLSVFNTYLATGNQPGVAPGASAASQRLSVFNTFLAPGSQPGVPPGVNAATETLSVFNSHVAPGSQPGVPVGSRTAFEMFSANNTGVGGRAVPGLSISRLQHGGARSGSTSALVPGAVGAENVTTLAAGETVEIDIAYPAGYLPELQFLANGAVLASSSSGQLKTWFTVPYGMKSLTLQAAGRTAFGEVVNSQPSQIAIVPDQGFMLSGLATDTGSRAAPGAVLKWTANGLSADYYQFIQPLSGVPDLAELTPARTAYASALNFPNPQEVFGPDPMGVGLGQNYAVRFHGNLSVDTAGEYQFQMNAQSGALLRIDGAVIAGTVSLTSGAHDIEAIYYDSGGATAAVQLLWTPPGGVQGVVPPSALTTARSANAAAGTDGRFQLSVPATLTGIHVVFADGQGSVVLDK